MRGVGMSVMPTPTSVEKDSAYWRQRADQARRAGDQEIDPTARETLLEIAEAYEKLAALTEAKVSAQPSRVTGSGLSPNHHHEAHDLRAAPARTLPCATSPTTVATPRRPASSPEYAGV